MTDEEVELLISEVREHKGFKEKYLKYLKEVVNAPSELANKSFNSIEEICDFEEDTESDTEQVPYTEEELEFLKGLTEILKD